ncbi:MAG: hypothetical protein ABSA92_00525 [Candidatus Bathyarchaeia archaeon]
MNQGLCVQNMHVTEMSLVPRFKKAKRYNPLLGTVQSREYDVTAPGEKVYGDEANSRQYFEACLNWLSVIMKKKT